MQEIKIFTFGGLNVRVGSEQVVGFTSQKTRALLVYLAIEGERSIARSRLAGLLWPDVDERRALHNLRQAFSTLRKVIGDQNGAQSHFIVTRQSIQLNPTRPIWVDAHVFGAAVSEISEHDHRRVSACRACVSRLRECAILYTSEFLRGFFLSDAEMFSEWKVMLQERYRQNAEMVLGALCHAFERAGDFEGAQKFASQYTQVAPWQEEAHRLYIRLLYLSGQRGAALHYYAGYKARLTTELGITPELETQTLAATIQRGATLNSHVPPHNLPPLLGELIGRTTEIAELDTWLQTRHGRLKTLVGLGGIGKTHLAIAVAHRHRSGFRDGCFLISLENLVSEDDLVTEIANAIGLRLRADDTPQTQVLAHLAGREMLLVLDNYEHLLPDTGFIVSLLQEAHQLKIIVTSRQILSLKAEEILDVAGLAYPDAAASGNDEKYDAVQLFTRRAERIKRDVIAPDSATRIAEICRLLYGHPLSIELAAAGVREFTLSEIVIGVQENLDFVRGEMADMPARHRSLRAVFKYSWGLLSAAEQVAFASLSVFAGPFFAQAALSVCGITQPQLHKLAERALLAEIAPNRYRLHPLLRAYASEYLPSNADPLHIAHTQFFATYAVAQFARLKTTEQQAALDDIQMAIPNLQAAWRWGLDHHQYTALAQLADMFYLYFEMRGIVLQAREMYELAVTAFQLEDDFREQIPPRLAASLLAQYGLFAHRTGDTQSALFLFEKSLKISQSHNLNVQQAFALSRLAGVFLSTGDVEKAIDSSVTAADFYREAEDDWSLSITLSNLGFLLAQSEEDERARGVLDEALALARQIGDDWNLGSVLSNVATIAFLRKEITVARQIFEESLPHLEAVQDLRGIAIALTNLGEVAITLGEQEKARGFLLEAIQAFEDSGNAWAIPYSLQSLGRVAFADGDLDEAYAHQQRAIALATQRNNTDLVVLALAEVANLYTHQNRLDDAVRLLVFLSQHESANREAKDRIDELMGELEAMFSKSDFVRLRRAGEKLKMDDFLDMVRSSS